MPNYCAAYGCSNSSFNPFVDGKRISFHKFPLQDNSMLKIWLAKIKRKNFKPTEHSRICSIHFEENCFEYQNFTNNKFIKKDAIPTIFCFNCPSKRKRTYDDVNHEFPLKEPERLQKWLKAIKRESWQPTKDSFLCSLHFTADSYKSNPRHFLKNDAVPSISCFSTDHPKTVRKGTVIPPAPAKKPASVSQKNVNSKESSDLNCSPKPSSGTPNDTLHKSGGISTKSSLFEASDLEIYKDSVCDGSYIVSDDEMNDFSDIEFSDSDDVKRRLEIMTAHYKKSRKKLKMCQQRCNLYKKEITALKEVINSLRQINSVSDDN